MHFGSNYLAQFFLILVFKLGKINVQLTLTMAWLINYTNNPLLRSMFYWGADIDQNKELPTFCAELA